MQVQCHIGFFAGGRLKWVGENIFEFLCVLWSEQFFSERRFLFNSFQLFHVNGVYLSWIELIKKWLNMAHAEWIKAVDLSAYFTVMTLFQHFPYHLGSKSQLLFFLSSFLICMRYTMLPFSPSYFRPCSAWQNLDLLSPHFSLSLS